MRKRSIGVTILGVLTILFALLGIPTLFDPKGFIASFIKPFGIILYLTSFPLVILEIVLGVGVLRLQEWARKYLLILTVVYAVSIFFLPMMEDKNYDIALAQKMKTEMQKTAPVSAAYHFSSTDGQPIVLKVDYALDGGIRNVAFRLEEKKLDGKCQYEIMSNEGKGVTLEFVYKDGSLFNMRIDTPFRPLPENRGEGMTLTLLSSEGKEIVLNYLWNDDGSIKTVNVNPKEEVKSARDYSKMTPEQRQRLMQFEENLPLFGLKFMKTFFLGLCFIFYVVTIIFFTRKRVKEQFE